MKIVKDKRGAILQRGDKVQFFAEGRMKMVHEIKHFKRDGKLHLKQPPQYFVDPLYCEKVDRNAPIRGVSVFYRKLMRVKGEKNGEI